MINHLYRLVTHAIISDFGPVIYRPFRVMHKTGETPVAFGRSKAGGGGPTAPTERFVSVADRRAARGCPSDRETAPSLPDRGLSSPVIPTRVFCPARLRSPG